MSDMNLVSGTPLYLAPESITHPDEVDARSDLYALGAVAYFLLVGKNVFEGATLIEVCSHHLHTPPVRPSVRLGRPVPEGLKTLILALLEKARHAGRRPPRRCSIAWPASTWGTGPRTKPTTGGRGTVWSRRPRPASRRCPRSSSCPSSRR